MKSTARLIILLLFVIIISFPYLVSLHFVGNDAYFAGFLLNPIDGNTYLSKMRQGFNGNWLFQLNYTHDHTNRVPLFGFYLLLGHFARWTGLSLIITFHLARIASGIVFFFVFEQFLKRTLYSHCDKRLKWAMLLGCFGSGLGWFVSAFGLMTPDFWVAEAYPFLSAYTSPHFILGMAICLWVMGRYAAQEWAQLLAIWILGILLGIIMPFGAVTTGLVLFLSAVWRYITQRYVAWKPSAAMLLGGGLIVAFQYQQIMTDPMLQVWNAQNVTPSPGSLNLVLGYSPALLFALIGFIGIVKQKREEKYHLVLAWLFASLILVAIPFSLQRRFMFAQFIPIAILATEGIFLANQKHRRILFGSLLFFSVLTNAFLIITGVNAAASGNPRMVLLPEEKEALLWLQDNAEENSILLCSPELGNFVPAVTDLRVLYGHPFETSNAEVMENKIIEFYDNSLATSEQRALMDLFQVQWVIMGPREVAYGSPEILSSLEIVYQNEAVTLYSLGVSP